MSECAGASIFTAALCESTAVRVAFPSRKLTLAKPSPGHQTVKMLKSTEVRSKLEFIIGTLRAGALQWREDHV
jgi:hypothetical protein